MLPEKPVIEVVPDTTDTQDESSDAGGKTGGDSADLKKIRENLKKEYERKYADDKKKLESSVDERVNKVLESRIKELEAKRNPSSAEEAELDKLKSIEDHPDSKAWRKFIEKIADERADQKLKKYDYDYAIASVKDKAEELSMDVDNFKEEINSILPAFPDGTPQMRVKQAFKEWKRRQDIDEKLKKAEEKEKEFAETGGRTLVRKPGVKEDFKAARETGNWSDVLSKALDKPKQ